jgi:hypothetical protein
VGGVQHAGSRRPVPRSDLESQPVRFNPHRCFLID